MKVIIQIPAYNEEDTIGLTLSHLPKTLSGVDTVEWLVINDGSRDRTVEQAKAHGAHHVVDLVKNQGLARAFMAGVEECLRQGADIIVNTDADNQYDARDIEKLIQPILAGEAEIVIGERPIDSTEHFSFLKKKLQKLGSYVMRRISNTSVPDAPSGFRAVSRSAALKLNVFNSYTYTLEMIIQAGKRGIAITSVPIRTNAFIRPSRLMKSIPHYIRQSLITMFRILHTYRPLHFFLTVGGIFIALGFILGLRWVIFFMGEPASHIPSLILTAILLLIGIQLCIFGFVADLISVNRKILEDIQFKIRDIYFRK